METTTSERAPTRGSETCTVPCFKQELVEDIKGWLPAEEEIRAAAAFHAIFADPTRLKILLALSRGELCVCDVSHVAGLSMSATSHQLRTLRNHNLVSYRNDGRMAYYALKDAGAVLPFIEQALARR